MNQIAPYSVWIGHAREGEKFVPILDEGIEAVVELAAEEPASASRRDLISCRFPLVDGPGNRPELLALAIRTVAGLMAAEVRTLVCCQAGMSRAPAIVAAALALITGEPPEKCLVRVARHHPSDVSPAFWNEVVELPPTLLDLPRRLDA